METRYFCIRGYMKSGTNWLCRILRHHPEVDCVGEFHWETFYQALKANANRINPKRKQQYQTVVQANLESLVQRSLSQFAEPDALWIGDRTPTTLQPVILTDAPHFVIVRDFRDVIVSRMFHLYNHPRVTSVFDHYPEMKRRLEKYQDDQWYFRQHPEELLANEEIIRTSAKEWSQFLASDEATMLDNPQLRVLRIKYEQLHSEFNSTVGSIFEFLGLDAPTSFPERLTPGIEVEAPGELNRKGAVGDWKTYMNDTCLGWIEEEAGEQLQNQGYCC